MIIVVSSFWFMSWNDEEAFREFFFGRLQIIRSVITVIALDL